MSKKWLLVFLFSALLGGCVSHVNAVTSVEGKAYMVQLEVGQDRMLYCDATDGNPECWPVQEQ